MTSQIRVILTALLGVLSALGILPDDVRAFAEQHVDQVVGLILLVWATVAFVRNRREKAKG